MNLQMLRVRTPMQWVVFAPFFMLSFSLLCACHENCVLDPSPIDKPDPPVNNAGTGMELAIGDHLYAVVGETLKVYFYSMVVNSQSEEYILSLTCDKGRSYARYWQYTPTSEDVGEVDMCLRLYDFEGNILDEKSVTLTTREPRNPTIPRHVLCLGNSLMVAGQTPVELSRRLKNTPGQAVSPEGLSLDNYFLVGRLHNEEQTVGWEGAGGWTWYRYLNEFDLESYADAYCEGRLDYVYLQLGINELISLTPFQDQSFILNHARDWVDRIHAAYPACRVLLGSVLLPAQKGGLGSAYPSDKPSGQYGEKGFNLKVHRLNRAYQEWARSEPYASFMYFIDNNVQFDCLHVYPSVERPTDKYVPGTESVETDGVHPTDPGYHQIAAGIFRALIGIEDALDE